MRGLIALIVFSLSPAATLAAELKVDAERSLLAVLTHKDGLAARLAHNHLVVADSGAIKCQVEASDILQTTCSATLDVDKLSVDDPEVQNRWQQRLEELKILEERFGELSAKDRAKIATAMLGPKQLGAESFPHISASLVSLEIDADSESGTDHALAVELELTIRDRTVRRRLEAHLEIELPSISVEAVGAFDFTEFGIEPYSALLGAVRNQNLFHLVIVLHGELPLLEVETTQMLDHR